MFKKIHLEPENKTFAEIMSNGKSYTVPQFQRDYSWEREQWVELWQDIERMMEAGEQHFMGYLVLQSKDGKAFEIIDGQQRVTTITLLVMAALNRFKQFVDSEQQKEDNEIRLKHYHDTFLGVFNPVTMKSDVKLLLNGNNRDHFKSIIGEPYNVPRRRGVTATNRLVNKALEFFLENIGNFQDGEKLSRFVDNMADNLLFTTITVTDSLNAYVVFETLNARGMQLSAPDLLKNYLLSALANGFATEHPHFEDFERAWSEIIEQLGEANFTKFLRSHHGMHDTLPPRRDLFRALRSKIKNPEQVMPYLGEISRQAPVYAALQNPDDSFWKDYGEGQYKSCTADLETLRLFRIRMPLSLLMSAYDKFSPREFTKVARWISVISIRYNVICNKATNDQEIIYNKLSIEVTKGKCSASDLKEKLKKRLYPDDDEFGGAFLEKDMPSRQSPKKIIHLLQQIERHCSDNEMDVAANMSLEHVLPKHPDDSWQEYFGRETYNEAVERLGNMALLPASQNRDIDRKGFDEKKKLLAASPYNINKKIAEHGEWNMDSVKSHQKWLAKQAKAVWKID